jgi:transposase
VVQTGEEDRGGVKWCVIGLEPKKSRLRCCSGCGQWSGSVHDRQERRIRDLPIFEVPVELIVPRLRLQCPRCGPKLEALRWLEPYARVTTRLANSVARLCKVLPVRQVADLYGLAWSTVKLIDWRYLERELGPVDLSGVRVIGMDEFAIHKGQRYATVVVEPERRRVLWVGRGHGREDIRRFFELLEPQGCRQIQAVVMDMSGAYAQEVKAQCPQADIVYDLFHVVAKYGREVIDRVRSHEAQRLRQEHPERRIRRSDRWLLLRNANNLSPPQHIRLKELLAANRALMKVYLLRDDLKALWRYRHAGYAQQFWRQWYRRAAASRVAPLQLFARRLKPYLPGILSHCRFPLHTSLIEGINNKIKVIKRMAYGFRDDEYFFLKIRAAFPGIR